MQEKIITISRQCGSGGHSVGSELAKRLDVPFYDKEIIEMAAKESGFHQGFVEEKEEHMSSSLLFRIAQYASYGGRGRYENYQPLQDQLYFAQVKVVKALAEKSPCVIVGRCADYILRDRKDVLHVFIHADAARPALNKAGMPGGHIKPIRSKTECMIKYDGCCGQFCSIHFFIGNFYSMHLIRKELK